MTHDTFKRGALVQRKHFGQGVGPVGIVLGDPRKPCYTDFIVFGDHVEQSYKDSFLVQDVSLGKEVWPLSPEDLIAFP